MEAGVKVSISAGVREAFEEIIVKLDKWIITAQNPVDMVPVIRIMFAFVIPVGLVDCAIKVSSLQFIQIAHYCSIVGARIIAYRSLWRQRYTITFMFGHVWSLFDNFHYSRENIYFFVFFFFLHRKIWLERQRRSDLLRRGRRRWGTFTIKLQKKTENFCVIYLVYCF